MKVAKLKYMNFLIFFFLISSILIGCANGKDENENKAMIITMGTIDVTIQSDKAPLEDGSYVVGTQLTFKIDDDSYDELNITIAGSERAFTVELKEGTKEWTAKWDTNNPTPGQDDDRTRRRPAWTAHRGS